MSDMDAVPPSLLRPPPPTNKLDVSQVTRAVKALLLKTERDKVHGDEVAEAPRKLSLFGDDEFFALQVTLKRVPKARSNPVRVSLPHPIFSRSGQDVALITKDPQHLYEEKLRECKDIPNVSQIISLERLRTEFFQFRDRKALRNAFDLFLADDRVLPLLPSLLGKDFFSRTKQPLRVKISGANFSKDIKAALDSTYFVLSSGVSFQMKIGTTAFTAEELVDNVMKSVEDMIGKIARGWSNIQSIHLKTSTSVALPIYSSLSVAPARSQSPSKKRAKKSLKHSRTTGNRDVNEASESARSKKRSKTGSASVVSIDDVTSSARSRDEVATKKSIETMKSSRKSKKSKTSKGVGSLKKSKKRKVGS